MKSITAFFMAWGNFCAIPCPCKRWEAELLNRMLVFFPILGLFMGFLWYGIFLAAVWLRLPLPLTAALLTIWPFTVSGFIHLDGFMDCSDAIFSRRPPEEKRRILKDPHVGAFAVISVVLLFVLAFAAMWSALALLITPLPGFERSFLLTLLFLPLLSRSCSAERVLSGKPLAASQYSGFDRNANRRFIIALRGLIAVFILLPLIACDIRAFGALFAGAAAAFVSCRRAEKQLEGMSGDIAGYMLTICELTGMLALVVFAR